MKKIVAGVAWQSWHMLWWLPLFLIVMCVVWYGWKKKERIVNCLVHEKWRSLLIPRYSSGIAAIKMVLMVVVLWGLFLALMRPSWGEKEQTVKQEGRDVFIALDISRSMLASDVKPNRLAFAKAKIKKLLKLMPSDRMGLIIFSGDALVQCPLTRDNALFYLFLDQIDIEMFSSGTTSIDKAIMKSIEVFKTSSLNMHKLLIVFTDGEDFSQQEIEVRERALEVGLHIFTYGIGTVQGAPIPILNQEGSIVGYEKNKEGNVVMSCLNEGILQALSTKTGAHYISPSQTDDDLKKLVAYVERYEKELLENKELQIQEDKYPLFLAVASLLLMVEWLL